ncbi:hypothetical protein C3L33_15531, partial [Rhododendron williamsianum]
MENKQSDPEDVSSAKAVLLGALAPGVNGPTWNTVKVAFLMLGLCLAAMLGLAFSSSDTGMILHVTLLVLITGTLFILLTRYLLIFSKVNCIWLIFVGCGQVEYGFLAETGLVSVEHQMQEMGLAPKDSAVIDKKSS